MVEFFNVSEHAVRQARKLKNEKEILATPSNYYREGLDKETKNVLLNFVREMSVICVQVKKIVLASEANMVQKGRFRRDFFWPRYLKYMPILTQNFQV